MQFGLVIEISFGETPADALGPTTPAFGERCTVASPTLLTMSTCKFPWGKRKKKEKKKNTSFVCCRCYNIIRFYTLQIYRERFSSKIETKRRKLLEFLQNTQNNANVRLIYVFFLKREIVLFTKTNQQTYLLLIPDLQIEEI